MPTVSSSQLDPPKSWDEFEEICADLFAAEWGDRNTVRHGRQGQRQDGVDIYGCPRDGGHAGVQCKGKRRWPPDNLTTQEIDAEVAKALAFRPTLTEYVIATTGLDDAHLQEHARRITERHHARSLFSVHIFGWGELSRRIAGHEALLQKHYSYTSVGGVREEVAALATRVEDIPSRVVEQLRAVGLVAETGAAADALSAEYNRELDSFRALADRGQPRTALDLLCSFEARVWANAPGPVRYRIFAVRAYCHDALNERHEAGRLLTEAETLDPDRPAARINAAYAALLRGDAAEARARIEAFVRNGGEIDSTAAAILVATARDDPAVADPLALIPESLHDDPQVAFAIGQFHRHRSDLELARRYLDRAAQGQRREPKIAFAEFILERTIASDLAAVGHLTDKQREDVGYARVILAEVWAGVTGTQVEAAHLNVGHNLVNTLRMLGRAEEARRLNREVRQRHQADTDLLRQAAYLAMEDGCVEEVLRLMEEPAASKLAERCWFVGEVEAVAGHWDAVLDALAGIADAILPSHLRQAALRLHAEGLARTGGAESAAAFLAGIETAGEAPLTVALARADVARTLRDREAQRRHACEALDLLPADAPASPRVVVAEALFEAGEAGLAADLLQPLIDTAHPSILLERYIQALFRDERDTEALNAIARIPEHERRAVHWSMKAAIEERSGDLRAAIASLEALLQLKPDATSYRLDWLSFHLRLDERDTVATFLERPLAVEPGTQEMQLAFIYEEIGRHDDALAVAYQALRHADADPAIHQAYIGLLLRPHAEPDDLIDTHEVGLDTAFVVEAEGERDTYVIEAEGSREGAAIRLAPTHPIAQRALGHKAGEDMVLDETEFGHTVGRIVSVKHKYLHALHDAMQRFNRRFPGARGLLRLAVQDTEDTFRIFRELANDHAERATQLRDYYLGNAVPVSMIAHLTGRHVLEVAAAFAAEDGPGVQCCVGSGPERAAASDALARASGRVLLDGLTALNAFNLGVQDVLVGAFGKLGVTQQTIDELSTLILRREQGRSGFMVVGRKGDQLVRQEVTADQVEASLRHLQSVRQWLLTKCERVPARFRERPEPLFREFMAIAGDEVPAVLGALSHSGRLLLSDDLHLRNVANAAVGAEGAWLQAALMYCVQRGAMTRERYEATMLHIAQTRYHFISLDAGILLHAARESDWGRLPMWAAVIRHLSGVNVDLATTLPIVGIVIAQIWSSPLYRSERDRITGSLLNAILAGHWADTQNVLQVLADASHAFNWQPELVTSLRAWCRGHFLPAPF
jgi:tetratricopeptide (TPR) repeat protein